MCLYSPGVNEDSSSCWLWGLSSPQGLSWCWRGPEEHTGLLGSWPASCCGRSPQISFRPRALPSQNYAAVGLQLAQRGRHSGGLAEAHWVVLQGSWGLPALERSHPAFAEPVPSGPRYGGAAVHVSATHLIKTCSLLSSCKVRGHQSMAKFQIP